MTCDICSLLLLAVFHDLVTEASFGAGKMKEFELFQQSSGYWAWGSKQGQPQGQMDQG